MTRLDAFLVTLRTFVALFLERLDDLHPAMIVPVVTLFAVVVGALALAVAIIAAAVAALVATGGVAVLARRVIVAAVAYSNRRRGAAEAVTA